MRPNRLAPALAATLLLCACGAETTQSAGLSSPPTAAQAAAAPVHEHEEAAAHAHGHAPPSALPTAPEARWPTDAALIEGMQAIRTAVADAHGMAALDAANAERLAQTIEERVGFLIANCRLAPEADATLHVLIGELLGAAAALRVDPAAAAGLPAMLETLRAYPRYFDHHGWVSIDVAR